MLHAQKIQRLSALSHMIEKTFQMDDLLHLMGPVDFQYLFYLRVFASLLPRTIHSPLFSEFTFAFKPGRGTAGLRLDTLLSDMCIHARGDTPQWCHSF